VDHLTRRAITRHPSSDRLSRRAIIKDLGTLGLSIYGVAQVGTRYALAAPSVTVAAPRVVRTDDCLDTVLVRVTIADARPGIRYEAYGDGMESDDPGGDPDFCCTLDPQSTRIGDRNPHVLLLTGEATAADMGLVKGVGPANDETFSPDLVELYARIWIRDLDTNIEHGPWESPPRVMVTSARLDWQHARRFPGSELLTPRGGTPSGSRDGIGQPLPPIACGP